MKLKFLPIALLFLLSLSSASIFANTDTDDSLNEVGNLTAYKASITAVRPGSGFSSDMDQIASSCWNVIQTPEAIIRDFDLDKVYDFNALENSLGLNITHSGSSDMFSGSPNADLLRSLEETSLSISFGYEASIIQQINTDVNWLNDREELFYDNPDINFRNICGDQVYADSAMGKGSKLLIAFKVTGTFQNN
ncbi:MAG: hypothetical protein GY710_20295 [Desulfobacteraceae bacterium]|nr:hypothetical protein [Desulfobacteraceae bacterium]